MRLFLSGPPGGLTLPKTPTKLSDLDGGVYGYGASVASSGHNVNRASVKAGAARDAGETWEDILEYYIVRLASLSSPNTTRLTSSRPPSSTQTVVKTTLHGA